MDMDAASNAWRLDLLDPPPRPPVPSAASANSGPHLPQRFAKLPQYRLRIRPLMMFVHVPFRRGGRVKVGDQRHQEPWDAECLAPHRGERAAVRGWQCI